MCWVISLGVNGTGNHAFPFAEELEQIIEGDQPKGNSKPDHTSNNEDSINAELLDAKTAISSICDIRSPEP